MNVKLSRLLPVSVGAILAVVFSIAPFSFATGLVLISLCGALTAYLVLHLTEEAR